MDGKTADDRIKTETSSRGMGEWISEEARNLQRSRRSSFGERATHLSLFVLSGGGHNGTSNYEQDDSRCF